MSKTAVAMVMLAIAPCFVPAQTTKPAEDAAALYIRAGDMVAANSDTNHIDSPSSSNLSYQSYPPFSPEWQQLETADYPANRPARELAHQARFIDRADWPHLKQPNPDLKYLNQVRALSNEIADASLYEHVQGNDAAAMETLLDHLHLADSLERPGQNQLIMELVSLGIRSQAMDRMNTIVAGIVLTNNSADHHAASIATLRAMIPGLINRPDPAKEISAMVAVERNAPQPASGNGFNVDRFARVVHRVDAECGMAALSIACHLYQFDHNAWPAALDDLRPYLPSIPIDPFGDGKQTLGYVLVKAGLPNGQDRPLVYSRMDATGLLFFSTEHPNYSYYHVNRANPAGGEQKQGGQFRDIAAWVPKAGASPATQPLDGPAK